MAFVVSGTPATPKLPTALRVQTGEVDDSEVGVGEIRVRLEASFDLPGPPMGLTFRGPDDGYIAIGTGEIAHFELSDELNVRTVADGLSQPRGLAMLDGRLYVTDIDLPCGVVGGLVRCSARDFPGTWPGPAQARILLESRGRVVTYQTSDDGSLDDERVVVDELPSATSDHAVNDIVAGPDGNLYVAIGNVDSLRAHPELLQEIRRPNLNLLGTIVRLEPDGGDLDVFARGVRNVYGLTFDDDGHLYGVDNDGPTEGGYRAEEVIRFEQGAHYGYPTEGTYGPFEVRTAGPLWTLRTNGSAGIAWAPRIGLEPGVVVGSCSQVTYVRFPVDASRPLFRTDERALINPRGCIPAVEAAPDGRLVIATINPNRLFVYNVRLVD